MDERLDALSLSELKEMAKEKGLKGISSLRKAELVGLLSQAEGGGEAPANAQSEGRSRQQKAEGAAVKNDGPVRPGAAEKKSRRCRQRPVGQSGRRCRRRPVERRSRMHRSDPMDREERRIWDAGRALLPDGMVRTHARGAARTAGTYG